MVETVLVYLLLGVVAGLVAGLLGVGGGIVIVPVLAWLFQAQGFDANNVMHLALGSSLATITVTALSSVRAHQRLGSLNWGMVWRLVPGLMAGAVCGAVLADMVASGVLRRLFGLFEVAVALYMFYGSRSGGAVVAERPLSTAELATAGGVIGTLSALLGIGGGTMTVPYLSWRGRPMHEAVAVSAACGVPIALAGGVSYLLVGQDASGLPPLASGYLYWPAIAAICTTSLLAAPLGARFAHALPVARLKRLFAVVLLVVGASMIL